MFDLVNKIKERDLVLGELASEATENAESQRFMAALACLFILMEQSIKLASNEVEGSFYDQMTSLTTQGILSSEEANIINSLRQLRNKLFHENHYMWFVEDKNGKAFPFSEPEGKEKIWNSFSEKIFSICLRLLTQP